MDSPFDANRLDPRDARLHGPEQARGERDIRPAADIFVLGYVMFAIKA